MGLHLVRGLLLAKNDVDLLVIGAGSGGVRAARIAALQGARVAIAEASRVGGTCVIRGCVPKKLMVYASQGRDQFEDVAGFGWRMPQAPSFEWATLVDRVGSEVHRLEGIYRKLLEDSGVHVAEGHARLLDPCTVDVDGTVWRTEKVLVATGARPSKMDIEGAKLCLTSDDLFTLPQQPQRILVVGGGFIALEFAGIFHGLGSQVTLSYRGAELLRGFDHEVRRHITEETARRGVRLLMGSTPVAVRRAAHGALAVQFDGSIGESEFDAVLLATGRLPNTSGLGLEAAGVQLGPRGAVRVDSNSQTSVANVYAVGDCTDRLNLTPVAIREGHAFANMAYGGPALTCEYEVVPAAVFSQPPVAAVGLTEEAARATVGEVDVYRTQFRPLKHAITGRNERAFMKLVVARDSQAVLGAHMVGADAPEIMQGIAIAVRAKLTKEQFDATVGIHPTSAEEFVTLRTPG